MLTNIRFHNFLSFADLELPDLGVGLYSIVGENGAGKSAILEGVLYTLYGRVRTASIAGVVREGTDSMETSVSMSLPDGKQLVITRGVKPSGTGYATLLVDNNTVASGNQVTAELERILGIKADHFMLTTFFGMRASDTILNVRPSERLETLQDIANVSIYKKFASAAAAKLASVSEIVTAQNAIASALLEEERNKVSRESIKERKREIAKLELKIETLTAQRAGLQSKIEGAKILIEELGQSKAQVRGLNDRLASAQADMADCQHDLQNARSNVKELQQQIEQLSGVISSIPDDISLRADKYKKKLTKTSLIIKLKSLDDEESTDTCPLCSAVLSESTLAKWKGDVDKLQTQMAELSQQLAKLQQSAEIQVSSKAELSVAEKSIEYEKSSIHELATRADRITTQIGKIKSAIIQKETRVQQLLRSVESAQKLIDQDKQLGDSISATKVRVAELRAECTQFYTFIQQAGDRRVRIRSAEAKLIAATKEKQACTILTDIFGRYGIPYTLLTSLREQLAVQATLIYQDFDDGAILVEPTEERGKPGIEIALQVSSGAKRSYDALSDGQRTIMYFAVRLALAQILADISATPPDFLILDELTGHLSAGIRDRLTSMMTRVLSKHYTQVFVTSHTTLRDIFDKTIVVEKPADISLVHIV